MRQAETVAIFGASCLLCVLLLAPTYTYLAPVASFGRGKSFHSPEDLSLRKGSHTPKAAEVAVHDSLEQQQRPIGPQKPPFGTNSLQNTPPITLGMPEVHAPVAQQPAHSAEPGLHALPQRENVFSANPSAVDKLKYNTAPKHLPLPSNANLYRHFANAHAAGQLRDAAWEEVKVLLQKPLANNGQAQHGNTAFILDEYCRRCIIPDCTFRPTDVDAVVEENYQRSLWRRKDTLEAIRHNHSNPFDIIKPFNPMGPPLGTYVWDWFTPDYICPSLERVGKVGDGGKWICDLDTLRKRRASKRRPCVMYSFGVNQETSFEEEMSNRTHCEIFAFDPTVPDLPESCQKVSGPAMHFYKQALGAQDGPTRRWLMSRSLLSLMKELGHTFIDVLKVDVEGQEWDVFESIFKAGALPVGQLLIELHYRDLPTTFRFFEAIEQLGYRIISRETNYFPTVTGHFPTCVEYSFLHPILFQSGEPDQASKSLLTEMPAYERQNGIVYVLTRKARIHSHLPKMLATFDRHFNSLPGRGYPLLVFHDDLDREDQQFLRSVTTTPLLFHLFQFRVPDFLDNAKIPERTQCSNFSSTIGYRHMCRFLGLEVQHLLTDYEYHWRLDDDSLFLGPIGYDPFVLMKANNKLYGFNRIMKDNPDCVVDLWNVTQQFVDKHHISAAFLEVWGDGVAFYNNFEISHRSVWQNSVVRDFLHYIDLLGGIYYVRWGDAPIRSLAVALAIPEEQLHYFSDVGYSHLPWHANFPDRLPAPITGALWHLEEAWQFVKDIQEQDRAVEDQMHHPRSISGIIVIFSSGTRYDLLKRCLISLELHFNAKHRYPIWIWSHNLSYAQRRELQSLSSAQLRIDSLQNSPSFPSPSSFTCTPTDNLTTRLLGWEVPQVVARRSEYQLRLADDAHLTADLAEDPFRIMMEGRALYGTVMPPSDLGGRYDGDCVRGLVEDVTKVLLMSEEQRARVADTMKDLAFDVGLDVSHRGLWQNHRVRQVIDVLESAAFVSRLAEVNYAIVRALLTAIVLEDQAAGLQVFNNLSPVQLPASLSQMQSEAGEKIVASQPFDQYQLRVSRDPSYLSQAFQPQELGFLDAELGVPLSLPRTLQDSEITPTSDLLWMLGPTRLGRKNMTRLQSDWRVSDAVALWSPQTAPVDFFWRRTKSGGRPISILTREGPGRHMELFATAGLVVQDPERGATHLVLLCQAYSTTDVEGRRQLGTSVVAVMNPREIPTRWEYEVGEIIAGTDERVGWHAALVLRDGGLVSTTPETDVAYIMGRGCRGPRGSEGRHAAENVHVLARTSVSALLRLSLDEMEVWIGDGRWAPYRDLLIRDSAYSVFDSICEVIGCFLPSQAAGGILPSGTGLGFLSGPGLWYVVEVSAHDSKERQESRVLVLRTARQVEGPWRESMVVALPSMYASARYDCTAVHVLPGLAADFSYEIVVALSPCRRHSSKIGPIEHERDTHAASSTALEVFRLRFESIALLTVEGNEHRI